MILQGLSPHWKLSHSVVWLYVCSCVRECLKAGGAQMLMPGDEVWRREGLMSLWSLFSALKISEVGRPYLHLCKLDRVFVALPVEPVDPLWKKPNKTPPNNTNHQLFLNYTSSNEQGASFTGKNLIFSLDNSIFVLLINCLWLVLWFTTSFSAMRVKAFVPYCDFCRHISPWGWHGDSFYTKRRLCRTRRSWSQRYRYHCRKWRRADPGGRSWSHLVDKWVLFN